VSVARASVAAFVVTLLVYAFAAAPVPFYGKAEPREALVARAVLLGNGVVLPLRDGREIPSKPPFFHWLAALSATVVRPVELAMRLPSVVLGAASVALVAGLVGRASGVVAGVLAAAVLASAFEWLRAATESRVDMTLTFLVLCATLAWRAALARDDGRGLVRVGWTACALAVLTKGPVGVVLPVLIAGAGAFAECTRSRLRRLVDGPGLALAFTISAGWYLLAWRVGGQAFLVKHVVQENLGRFVGRGEAGHAHPFWYYGPALLVGVIPWTPALVAPIRRRSRDGLARFALAWFAAVFVFYSISTGKRSAYLLPLYPPLAIVIGRALADGLGAPLARGVAAVLRAGAAVLAALGVAIAGAGVRWIEPHVAPLLHRHDRAQLPLIVSIVDDNRVAILAVMALAAAGLLLMSGVGARRATGVVAVALAWTVGLSWVGARPFGSALTPRAFAARVNAVVGDAPLCARGWVDFDARWYLERPLPHCKRHDPATRFILHQTTERLPHHRHCVATRLVDDNPALTAERLQLDEQLPDCGHRGAR